MAVSFETEVQQAVWDTLQRINRAWLHGEEDVPLDALHPEMVIVPPGFQQRIVGREACAKGYRAFARDATVDSYEESDADVRVFGDTAIASYRYVLTYEMDGAAYRDEGVDLYVFTRADGHWQAAWRALVPHGDGQDEG